MGKFHIGGQAVIEGVMMRGRDDFAVAVRKPDGKIAVEKNKFLSLASKKPWSFPFIRGMIVLFETLYLGMKALSWSANMSIGEEEEELSNFEILATIAFSLVIALILFKLLPLGIASIVNSDNNLVFNFIDGFAKVLILILYLLGISLMKDVKRMFQYHGAEHMTVACFESKKRLTVANVKKFPKEHPRCGTAFILVVLLLSVFFYMFIPITKGFWTKYLIRILLLPVIAGVSYEVIRMAGKYKDSVFSKIISYPGTLMQYITTKDPSDDMIEVAIKSLNAVK